MIFPGLRLGHQQLRAARQSLAHGAPPVVAFDFVNVVSDEVATALRSMGAEVAGTELTLTMDRMRDGVLAAPFASAYEPPDVRRSRHAMWWAEASDTAHAHARSETRAAITRAYRAMSGIESLMFTLLLRSLGAIALRSPRVELPERTACFTAREDDVGLHLVVSRERGCRLVFSTERTTPRPAHGCGHASPIFPSAGEGGSVSP